MRVAPFGHLRITGCLRLPVAFRSLPRPSSPFCAKASVACLYTLGRKQSGIFQLRFCNDRNSILETHCINALQLVQLCSGIFQCRVLIPKLSIHQLSKIKCAFARCTPCSLSLAAQCTKIVAALSGSPLPPFLKLNCGVEFSISHF